MKTLPFKLLSLALAVGLSPLRAAIHDTGPMGVEASGAATPDASVLSKMHLPDAPTPMASTPTAASIQRDAVRNLRAHVRWTQLQVLSAKIDAAEKKLKLNMEPSKKALAALQEKYHLKLESDGTDLSRAQSQSLKAELQALDKKVDQALPAAKP